MSERSYVERRCALRWPLVAWGLGLPLVLITVFVVLGVVVNPDWFVAAGFTPMFVPVLVGTSLLCRNWATGIRMDERGVAVGAVGSRRAARRRPTVTYQNWGLFSCGWPGINGVRVVTDPAELREIRKSAEYWTLSNRWGKPREMTRCMAGVLTAPFMKAALVVDVGAGHVIRPELRSTVFFANWIGGQRFASRLRAVPSPVWVVPTRDPDGLRDFLTRNQASGERAAPDLT